MGGLHLAVAVLQEHAVGPVQHAGRPQIERRGVEAAGHAFAGGFHADEAHAVVLQKRVEHADGVGAAAHAGHHGVGQAAGLFQHLRAGFLADDALQHAHQGGEGVRSGGRAEAVVGGFLAGDPGAQGLVDGILEGTGAAFHRVDFRAQEFHAGDVGGLAFHVFRAHVDGAAHAQARGSGGRGHAVLTRARFGHQGGLAHVFGQQGLAQGVVDLVRAGVEQVFALEPEIKAQFAGERGAVGQGGGPPGVVVQQVVQFFLKRPCGIDVAHGRFHFHERRHEQFGYKAAAELSEVTIFHDMFPLPFGFAAATAAAILSAFLRPGASSTPELKSTPPGVHRLSAARTLSGPSPPASSQGCGARSRHKSSHSRRRPLPPPLSPASSK